MCTNIKQKTTYKVSIIVVLKSHLDINAYVVYSYTPYC